MHIHMTRLAATFLVAALLAGVLPAEEYSAEQIEFFEAKIRPVLATHCYACHSSAAEKIQGGLKVDSREAIRGGGDSGPAVVPGSVDQSLLIAALRYETYEMPPAGKLAESVIADFERWIELGAADPRDGESHEVAQPSAIDFTAAREFWSFQAPGRHPLPTVSDPSWVRTPIDAFVLGRLDQVKLSPRPEAQPQTLARRLYFDLIGLPPTPAELEAFLADKSPDAYERLVDRLLASPRFGEKWASMWLDIARYAEDQAHIVGNNQSLFYPNAWLYRDWVIGAFNRDLPYDEFLRLQLAADLIEGTDSDDLPALGFLGLGPKYYRRNAPEVMADEWEDRVDVVSRGLLGLTVACARCHDHKYDPIPTADYYALAGVFASTDMFNKPLSDKEMASEEPADDDNDGDESKNDITKRSMHIVREGKPRDLPIHVRGDASKLGPVAERGFPQILCSEGRIRFSQGSGRSELAAAITHPANPLTARVIVNRVWSMHFGRPLVGTPSNFGKLGQPPTHPLLLDDLAVRFMEHNWSLKWLHREIVLSSTWRQSSEATLSSQSIDPGNQWLSHMNRRRMTVEAWRDSLLAAAGRLEPTVGGTSIDPTDIDEPRRTVYSAVSRLELHPLLAMFDRPDPNVHSGRRVETTTPLQKMFVMNSPFMVETAAAFAGRCMESGGDDRQRVAFAYRTLYSREPQAAEIELLTAFLDSGEAEQEARWQQAAQAMFAANEAMFID